ncbi:hypothetical protein [Adonisia turfae]|nr:hypothetical protein [Adonisia turfae]
MNTIKKRLEPMTVHLHPDDIFLGKKLEDITGVGMRVHLRSAFRQYLRAHSSVIKESNSLNFNLETSA